MNYYKRHLGDYAKDTKHLSLAEHGAFCLLLDYYYATEKPIPDDRCERIANASTSHEQSAVRAVLNEFFVLTPEGWINVKANEVIAESYGKSLKAKASAEARWNKPGCERNANASEAHGRSHSERNASHKPLPTTHKESDGPRKKVGNQTLAAWVLSLPEAEEIIPVSDSIYDWALDVGLPREWIALAWTAFENKYGEDDKAYKDWRAVFRKAVKGDWLKVWRPDPQGRGWVLTTVGEMAQRERHA